MHVLSQSTNNGTSPHIIQTVFTVPKLTDVSTKDKIYPSGDWVQQKTNGFDTVKAPSNIILKISFMFQKRWKYYMGKKNFQ